MAIIQTFRLKIVVKNLNLMLLCTRKTRPDVQKNCYFQADKIKFYRTKIMYFTLTNNFHPVKIRGLDFVHLFSISETLYM